MAGGLLAASLTVAGDAATVNGTTITRSDVDGDLAAIAGSPPFQCYLDAQVTLTSQGAAQLPPLAGAGPVRADGRPGTYNSSYVGFWMRRLVNDALVQQLAAAHHVTVDRADMAAAKGELAASIDGTFATLSQAGLPTACSQVPSSAEVLASLPAPFVQDQVRSLALIDGLSASAAGYRLTPSGLQSYFASHRSSFDTLCVDAFTVATQASAKQIRSLIQGGLPFAAAAPAGTLQSACVTPSDANYGALAAVVGSLQVGQVSQPVPSQTGSYYLFQLTNRTATSLAVTSPVLREAVVAAGAQRAGAMLTAAARRASVTIDPRYGRWTSSSAARGVFPPSSPPASSLLAPAANTATGLPATSPLSSASPAAGSAAGGSG